MSILYKLQNAFKNAPKRFAKAVVYYAEKGHLVTAIPQNVANQRLAICHECEKYDVDTDTCKVCECEMQVKTRLKQDPIATLKAVFTETKPVICPLESPKWLAYINESETGIIPII